MRVNSLSYDTDDPVRSVTVFYRGQLEQLGKQFLGMQGHACVHSVPMKTLFFFTVGTDLPKGMTLLSVAMSKASMK